ncbi:MAG: carbohydrate kinase [Verrucomicrobia bacterium]|nr:MAG: carbohydrate kinase [Verrucomicrobiota bacterium]
MTSIAPHRVEQILGNFESQRIVVIGDLMLDRYVYGTVERISPEAPVPVVEVTDERSMPGGAGNVASNIRSLGGAADICAVVGMDAWGEKVLELLHEEGVGTDPVVRAADSPTTVKTRVIAEHQQVVRVDREKRSGWSAGVQGKLVEAALGALDRSTGVILEDYGKGVISQGLVDRVLAKASASGLVSGLDPKENHSLSAKGLTVATPNRREAYLLATGYAPHGTPETPPLEDHELLRATRILMEKWSPRFLAVTLGSHGMLVVQPDESRPLHIPTRAREVYDVSGAGDTVIAACVLALAAGASPVEAAEIANFAAGVVVGKLGTATCSRAELLHSVQEQERG